ncbi:peptidylprolyl isomerase fpr3 [Rhodotorula sphaerocarpa]
MASPLILGLWSYGAEVKGNARSVVTMKYPEFESDDEDDEDEDDEEDDDEEDEENIKLPQLITKETVLACLKPNGTEQVSINVNLVEDVEVVEFSVSGENPVHLVGHYIRQEDFDEPPSSDEEGYGSDEFDEDDMSGEDISGLIDMDDEEMDDEEEAGRIQEIEDAKPSKKRAAAAEADAPAGADDSTASLSKNQKKKLAKKQKADNGEAVAPAAAAVPEPKKKAEEPKKAAAESKKTQVIAGGLEITDVKVGEGAAAKTGSKVGMRYIGKLENGKVFDSNTKGAPLTFTLGRGQVIKGWDFGVAGIKVGGERKLRIPAKLAYGSQKIAGIPPNSTLLFDIKCVKIA